MEIEVVLDQEIEVVLNGGNPGGALCGKFDIKSMILTRVEQDRRSLPGFNP